MKKKRLTKKLIIALAVWVLLIGASLGLYLWLDSNIQKLESETTSKERKLTQNEEEYEKTAKNIQNNQKAEKLFQRFEQSDDSDKDLFRRNVLIRKLGEITNELGSVKMSFKMSPFEKFTPIQSTENVEVVRSKIIMEFFAITDIDAFKMIEKLHEKINGTIYFKKFQISKVGEIDNQVLLGISNENPPNLVKGEVEFDWISVRLLKQDNNEEGA